ncbi:MAG: redoxin domain-containing protein [Thermoguttaceae bacterium]|jgi:peroxiredoxin
MSPISRSAAASAGVLLAILWTGCSKPEPPAPLAADGESQGSKAAEKLTTASAVLERMARAYQKASSYADFGTLQLQAQTVRGPIDWSAPYSVKLVRPNKLRLELNDGVVCSDGQRWNAWIHSITGQFVSREAPARLTVDVVAADGVLAAALSRGFDGRIASLPWSPQLSLLLGDDPVRQLLGNAESPALLEPGKIGDDACYRVQAKWPDGVTVFWIEQQSFALRRVVFPTAGLWQLFGGEKQVESLSLVADFVGAKLDAEVDAKAFQFSVPQGAEQVKMFLPPDMYQLLGKPVPDFKFIDRQGKPVTPKALAGKAVVLAFWNTGYEPCYALLQELEKVYQKEKSQPKLALLAVNLDPKETENKALDEVLADLKVTLPLARDPDEQASGTLRVYATPSVFILGADGVLQECELGEMADFLQALPARLEKLLAGDDLSKEAIARYQGRIRANQKVVDDAFQGKMPENAVPAKAAESTVTANVAETQPRTEPKTLKLVPLWKAGGVKSPGNILVVPGPEGTPSRAPRIFVIDELKSIVELGTDGKPLATHRPNPDGELVSNLRTAVGGDGKRIFAAFGLTGQQFFCFDADWKQFLAFPDAAIKANHGGIADVALGDADGSGVLRAYVGYWGATGIQKVSLEGKRLRSNRTLLSVVRTALGPPDRQNHRSLVCAYQSTSGALAVLDANLDRQGEILVPNWPIGSIQAADLLGDGKPLWAALSVGAEGQTVILGVSLRGDVLWTCPLPKGLPRQPIERIIPGRIAADGPGLWILPGADGSIHFVSAEGKVVDRFNYGAVLGGLATAVLDGKPVLLVASENGLEALAIQ